MDKLANYVNDELRRVAFFLQYAGEIEKYFPRMTKNILLNLPVKWKESSILIHGKRPEQTTEDDYFYSLGAKRKLPIDILIQGEIKDRSFTFKIVYGDNSHNYYLDFEDGDSYGHKKTIRNMKRIKDIFDKIESGEEHQDKDLEEVFVSLFKGKKKYNQLKEGILDTFFKDYKHLNWVMVPRRDKQKGGVLKIPLFATNASPKEYEQVFKMFTETDPERATFKVTDLLKNKITNYVDSVIKDAGFDVELSIKGIMKPKVDEEGNLSGKLGFTITIE